MADRLAYIGFDSCGCPVAAMVAGVDSERSERAELKRWQKRGYRIKVMDTEEARALPCFLACPHDKRDPTTDAQAELDQLVLVARPSGADGRTG